MAKNKGGRPKLTDEQREVRRQQIKESNAARMRQKRAEAKAIAEGREPPARPVKSAVEPEPQKPKVGSQKKPKAPKPSKAKTEKKPVEPKPPKPGPVAKSGWAGMTATERRQFLRIAIDDNGRKPIDVADELDISLSIVAQWYRDATGRPLPTPELDAQRMERSLADVERRNLDALERSRRVRQLSTSIGAIPPVKTPELKALLVGNLHLALQWYFPKSTGLKPLGSAQIQLIDRFELSLRHPSRFLSILARGFTKTSISVHCLLLAALWGKSVNSVFVGANDERASEAISSIKQEILGNDRLLAHYPEAIYPLRHLDNKPQRCLGQSYQGRLTMPVWAGDVIVFPSVPGSPASGNIIQSKGLESAARGMSYKRADGRNTRPTTIVIDDPQTEKSAKSIPEIRTRSEIIRKGIGRLGGHGSKCSVILNGTPIQPRDLIEQLSDRKLHPGWSQTRSPYFTQMPDEAELKKHWLGPYAQILTTFDADDVEGQLKAERAALEYYIEHRAEMDEGFDCAWWSCPTDPNQISAIQHGMDVRITEGEDVFLSELQLAPQRPSEIVSAEITSESIRYSNYAHRVLPKFPGSLVFGVDCHESVHYYTVAAVQRDFTAVIVDYGCFPQQPTSFFTHAAVKNKLNDVYRDVPPEMAIQKGVEELLRLLLSHDWRTENGDPIAISAGCIDSGFAPDAVAAALRATQPASNIVVMTKGVGVGAKNKPFSEYDLSPKRVIRCGPDSKRPRWIIPTTGRQGSIYRVDHDTNFWKDCLAARLTQHSPEGMWRLYGNEFTDHAMYLAHLQSEAPVRVSAAGRAVNEWAQLGSADNHWFDTAVLCTIAASLAGCQLPTASPLSPPVVQPAPQPQSPSDDFSFFITAR